GRGEGGAGRTVLDDGALDQLARHIPGEPRSPGRGGPRDHHGAGRRPSGAAARHELAEAGAEPRRGDVRLPTDPPRPGARRGGRGVELVVGDGKDGGEAGVLTFDLRERWFEASRVFDTEVGPIRAFRMYYSWFL